MAKRRNSVFGSEADPKKIKQEAAEIEKKVTGKPTGKKKHLYVDLEHHAMAKVSAAKKGMALGEYIEHLIRQDAQ